ncbi:hypothetical protein ScPMuIL_015698 [Solemya velum]
MAASEIKRKFRNLLGGKQEPVQSPIEENFSHEQFSREAAVTKAKNQRPRNPHEEQEIFEAIEEAYYNNESFDTSEFELKKVPEVLDLEKIEDDGTTLRQQLQVVSKKVSELVLQNHPAYAAELQRVMELQKALQLASIICANGRRQLTIARESFTAASLGLLANYKKRQQLVGLLKSLRTIKTLQRTDLRLKEMMEEEDYCGAIQLCLECQKAASIFRHYKCISELNSKLQDTFEMIEEQLDVALSKTCLNFDVDHYEKVQTAYRLLGKTQTAMDQLHMHFTSAIHNTAFQIVLGYVELCSGTGSTNFQKRQYSDLCMHISIESFTPCLIDLCKALWGVMKSYYRTMAWHDIHDEEAVADTEGSGNIEATFNRCYIKQKLEHGLVRIWQDVQQKVKTYILGTDLSEFKLEGFIQVLDLVNRMIEIGEEFCKSKSEGLQDSLKQQSLNYFRNHHRARMDELRMFLENEGWELCPVKSSFQIMQLMEFRFMRNLVHSSQASDKGVQLNSSSPSHHSKYFERYATEGNPFETQQEEEENEDVWAGTGNEDDSDSDSDIPDVLKQDFIDEITGETHSNRQPKRKYSRTRSYQKNVPIVTNTSLNVFRVIGKYMQMMTVLKPIAFDVMTCMAQLLDYYLYTVYIFFGAESSITEEKTVNNRLWVTLQRIQENMIAESPVPGAPPLEVEDRRDKVSQPHISPIVNLISSDKLYGLAERIVAAESLVFLGEQLELLEPHLEILIPPNRKAFLQQFYSQTVKMATELRKPVYWSVTGQSVDYDNVLQHMNTVRWDVKDIMSQHNSYVDHLLMSFQNFGVRLSEVGRRVPIPKAVYDTLWEHCVRLANRTFVDGYANAKKCSNEGRALMQLDFQQFLSKLEKLVDIKPIPEREYVEMYIKAYYLPESQLELWLQDHKEYSNKHLLALINTVDHINKKGRQRLIGLVEELERYRR